MQYELKQFNIRVKLIEPGVIATDFYNRSMTVINNKDKDYRTYTDKILPAIMKNGETGSSPVHLYQFLTQIGIDFESVIKKADLERLAWEHMPDLSNQEYFALLTVLELKPDFAEQSRQQQCISP